MLIALHKGRGFIGRLIQWQTRSVYSHASVVLRGLDGPVIESREFQGVRELPQLDLVSEDVDLFSALTRASEREMVRAFLYRQVGKPYDYSMVARFISRRQASRRESGRWFCSELVFAAFLHAGIRLLDRIEPWAVSPGLLALSPLLRQVSIQEVSRTRNAERGTRNPQDPKP